MDLVLDSFTSNWRQKRYAPVEVVDEIIELWQEHRKTLYAATR